MENQTVSQQALNCRELLLKALRAEAAPMTSAKLCAWLKKHAQYKGSVAGMVCAALDELEDGGLIESEHPLHGTRCLYFIPGNGPRQSGAIIVPAHACARFAMPACSWISTLQGNA